MTALVARGHVRRPKELANTAVLDTELANPTAQVDCLDSVPGRPVWWFDGPRGGGFVSFVFRRPSS